MAQPNTIRSPSKEADILLAISALKQRQIKNVNQAAATYNVPESTLRNRLAGKPARRDCQPNSKKLTRLEEEVIVKHILDLDSRGFPPTHDAVRHIANKLLAERGAGAVGKLWPYNFVKRTESLATRFSRTHDRQRALREDTETIGDQTPSSLLALPEPIRASQTSNNARDLEAQLSLVRERIERRQSLSHASIIESLTQFIKGAEMLAHSAILLRDQVSALQKANKATTKCKERKRKRIQKQGTSIVAEGVEIAAQTAATHQLEDERRQDAAQSDVTQRAVVHCSRCKEPGHNSRTCKKDTVDNAQH